MILYILPPYLIYAWLMVCNFQQYFNYIVAVSFIGRGNQKKPTELS